MTQRILFLASAAILVVGCAPGDEATSAGATADDPAAALIARGQELEIPGEWVIPPGDPLVHSTAGFAKILCSNVFLSGLDPEFAAANTGFFSAPAEFRGEVTDTVVDYENRRIHLTLPDGTVRSAKQHGRGCLALPIGESEPYYEAVDATPDLPDPETTPWPMGDLLPDEPFPEDVDMDKVAEAVDAAFDPPEGLTAAFVVTHRGRLIGERYREGIDHTTPLESWSMGKSLTGTLMGTLIQKGVYDLWQSAPVPEWQGEGDPRQAIRIGDIMRMSSGTAVPGAPGPRLRSGTRIPRPPLCLYRHGELLPMGGQQGPAMGTEHRWTVPQLRPRDPPTTWCGSGSSNWARTTTSTRSATSSTSSASAT